MEKLNYIESYQDSGLYREWIINNLNYLYQRPLKLVRHIKALAKLAKLSFIETKRNINEDLSSSNQEFLLLRLNDNYI